MRIYTRRGDEGETGLLYGGRVSKTDLRCEAYGTTDEAVSLLGLARSLSRDERVREIVRQVERELFTVGAELATDSAQREKLERHFGVVSGEMVVRLEGLIDELGAQVKLPRAFVLPGGSPASAALDVARTVVRRAERRAVELKEQGMLANPEVVRYLNRLSDLVFMLARYEDRGLTQEELIPHREGGTGAPP
ncbi:MAG: cob(I)yrinic acid a,c-diamide adenosyltransferase [Chloroflexi bacterium]|nr:cob(I)yrinic acid a,c-diamide adenosyltransferase [Chloroflexota bacterium]